MVKLRAMYLSNCYKNALREEVSRAEKYMLLIFSKIPGFSCVSRLKRISVRRASGVFARCFDAAPSLFPANSPADVAGLDWSSPCEACAMVGDDVAAIEALWRPLKVDVWWTELLNT